MVTRGRHTDPPWDWRVEPVMHRCPTCDALLLAPRYMRRRHICPDLSALLSEHRDEDVRPTTRRRTAP